MQNVSELTQVETIALGALKAESQRLQTMNLQFNAALANVTKEIENNHKGYTLNHSTLLLEIKPEPATPVIEDIKEAAPVLEMPAPKEY